MKVTIFTPTYNRKNKLYRLYESLLKQTSREFIWLVVDDGSNDGTKELIEKFKLDKKIEIIYHFQENSGKHIAHNKGVELCKTELFFCVDSDDYIIPNAIEFILKNASNLNSCIGIVALRGYSINNVMGNYFKAGINRATLSDLYNLYGKKGETALIFRTKYLKENYFIKFEGEKFLSEEILYNKLDNIGALYIINRVIYIMEYLEDGLTKNYKKLWKQSPRGVLELLNSRYKKSREIKGVKKFYRCLRVILVLNSFCLNRKINIKENTPNKILSTLLIIPSYVVSYFKFK
ncbi:glycosyltransferase family 2 protein [Clostridium chauvoei]|uniref:Glycosyltransferase family 2 protein n=6 Tax=Clostridium chauvoei TaxID=46867 RepID=A0ABD4RF72_9CLOT|nr:glycosyltransferase family 2 protein [Clostridium chauvoei]ATD54284.1 hypothetical protein BTM20_03150 [Clostridium chauvoei]ATD58033.1 hypothetical protein BTM21_09915 [Clostridium chauvoei]MBX7279890.1 glycosyltransferase family 2 protein [Clostridium chauvoei]MBX7282192.1 glycosyltransferase family 2 protein [Clostridium chauvoei]MBX7284780.1 glycosyltransferase family 2 protein [Clostridium chauvoei]